MTLHCPGTESPAPSNDESDPPSAFGGSIAVTFSNNINNLSEGFFSNDRRKSTAQDIRNSMTKTSIMFDGSTQRRNTAAIQQYRRMSTRLQSCSDIDAGGPSFQASHSPDAIDVLLQYDDQLKLNLKKAFYVTCSHGWMIDNRSFGEVQWNTIVVEAEIVDDEHISQLFIDTIWIISRDHRSQMNFANFVAAMVAIGGRCYPRADEKTQLYSLWTAKLSKYVSRNQVNSSPTRESINPSKNDWPMRVNNIISIAIRDIIPSAKLLYEWNTDSNNGDDAIMTIDGWLDFCIDTSLVPELIEEKDAEACFRQVCSDCDYIQIEDFIDGLVILALVIFARMQNGAKIYLTHQSRIVELFSRLSERTSLSFNNRIEGYETDNREYLLPLPVRISPSSFSTTEQTDIELSGIRFYCNPSIGKQNAQKLVRALRVQKQFYCKAEQRNIGILGREIFSQPSREEGKAIREYGGLFVKWGDEIIRGEAITNNRISFKLPENRNLDDMSLFLQSELHENNELVVKMKWVFSIPIEVSNDGICFSSSGLTFRYEDEYEDTFIGISTTEQLIDLYNKYCGGDEDENTAIHGLHMKESEWNTFRRDYRLLLPAVLPKGLPVEEVSFSAVSVPQSILTFDSITIVEQVGDSSKLLTDNLIHGGSEFNSLSAPDDHRLTLTGFLLLLIWTILPRLRSGFESSLLQLIEAKQHSQEVRTKLRELENQGSSQFFRNLLEDATIRCPEGHNVTGIQIFSGMETECGHCQRRLSVGSVGRVCTVDGWIICQECVARNSGVSSHLITSMISQSEVTASDIRVRRGLEPPRQLSHSGKRIIKLHNTPSNSISLQGLPKCYSLESLRKLLLRYNPTKVIIAPSRPDATHMTAYALWSTSENMEDVYPKVIQEKVAAACRDLNNKIISGSRLIVVETPALSLALGERVPGKDRKDISTDPTEDSISNKITPLVTIEDLTNVYRMRAKATQDSTVIPFSKTVTSPMKYKHRNWISKPIIMSSQ